MITEDNLVGPDRHRPVLHGHRREVGHLRDRQPAPGDRAAHGHHAAQRHRRDDAGGDADLRDNINPQLRVVLDEATGKWGIRVNRVELKSVDPPGTIQEAMEKQMRAERDRRAAILTAEGVKQSADPHRRGREAVGGAQGRGRQDGRDPARRGRRARRSRPSSRRSTTATPTRSCSATSTCRCCRSSRRATANKIFVIPSEFTQALGNIGQAIGGRGPEPGNGPPPRPPASGGTSGAAGCESASPALGGSTPNIGRSCSRRIEDLIGEADECTTGACVGVDAYVGRGTGGVGPSSTISTRRRRSAGSSSPPSTSWWTGTPSRRPTR